MPIPGLCPSFRKGSTRQGVIEPGPMPGSEPEHGPQTQVDPLLPGSLPSVGAESPELFSRIYSVVMISQS